MNFDDSALIYLGEFDPYCLCDVLSIIVENRCNAEEDRWTGRVELVAVYSRHNEDDRVVVLELSAFTHLRLPEIFSDGWQFRELEIHDVSRNQLEGINYELTDFRSEFECSCRDVNLLEIFARDRFRTGASLWKCS